MDDSLKSRTVESMNEAQYMRDAAKRAFRLVSDAVTIEELQLGVNLCVRFFPYENGLYSGGNVCDIQESARVAYAILDSDRSDDEIEKEIDVVWADITASAAGVVMEAYVQFADVIDSVVEPLLDQTFEDLDAEMQRELLESDENFRRGALLGMSAEARLVLFGI